MKTKLLTTAIVCALLISITGCAADNTEQMLHNDAEVIVNTETVTEPSADTQTVTPTAETAENEYHDTIVNTNYKYILTTNYDTLLDKAARHQKHYELLKRSYSYKDLQRISEAIYTGEPAIIHIHGIATEVVLEDFILTADDYKQIRDKNRGLRTLLNILFMNYSMLMVGYGASDPHLEDVIEDINLSFGWFDSDDVLDLPMYYLVIKKDKVSPIFDQLKNRNRTRIIAVDEHEEALALLKHLQAKFPRS